VDEDRNEIILLTPSGPALPALVVAAGPKASRRFVEFFTANIRNKNTRDAYHRNITAFLAWWETEAGIALDMIEPMVVAAYVEKLLKDGLSKPTVKQTAATAKAGDIARPSTPRRSRQRADGYKIANR